MQILPEHSDVVICPRFLFALSVVERLLESTHFARSLLTTVFVLAAEALKDLVEVALQGRQHSGGLGDSFEEMAVVNFRSNLTDLIVETFPNSDLEGLSVLTKSSYGIMVKSCKNQDQKKQPQRINH